MARASPLISTFNSGEWSPRLEGRSDLAKYGNACAILENWMPLVTGPAQKRSGFRFVSEVKDSSKTGLLVPFEFSTVQQYILEFGDEYMRVYKDGAIVTNTAVNVVAVSNGNPVNIQATTHGLSNNDRIVVSGLSTAGMGIGQLLNNREFIVTVVDPNNVTLAYAQGGAAVNGAGYVAVGPQGTIAEVYEIATPYQDTDLQGLIWAQSADVLYLAHPAYAPRKLSRTGHASWTLTQITFDWPPFQPENPIKALTLTASAATGVGITITASAALFTAADVGRLIRIGVIVESEYPTWVANLTHGWTVGRDIQYAGNVYNLDAGTNTGTSPPIHETGAKSDGASTFTYLHAGYGYVEIKTFTDTTHVVADVVQTLPTTSATNKWAFGAWDAVSGFPRAVTFHEDRLWWAGSNGNPQTLWASRVDDYENHRVNDNAESALSFTISSDQVNVIHWMMSWRNLVLGTSGGEIVASGLNPDEAISPENPLNVSRNQSTYGTREGVRPIRVENALIFAQRSGQKLRELVYEFDSDSYIANDLTLTADHIAAGQIRQLGYQQEPGRLVWACMNDGDLAALTYERSQDVFGWHRHSPAGEDVIVESAAVERGANQDRLWALVSRTIDGATHRYVERLDRLWEDSDSISSAFYVDSGLTYTGTPVTQIHGLWHLEGETVQILADGAVHPDRTVTNGTVTLAGSASVVQVGLGYVATLQTMRLEAGAVDGTAQGKHKRISDVVLRLHQSGAGLYFGATNDLSKMAPVYFRTPAHPTGDPVPLFTGDTERQPWPGGFERDGRITVKHILPLPCTLIAALPRVDTQER